MAISMVMERESCTLLPWMMQRSDLLLKAVAYMSPVCYDWKGATSPGESWSRIPCAPF